MFHINFKTLTYVVKWPYCIWICWNSKL